jgi:hypothetical protein
MMDNSERIRLRAYEIWIQQGQPEGREFDHWQQARREVLGSQAENRDENGEPEQAPAESQQSEGQQSEEKEKLKESTELG